MDAFYGEIRAFAFQFPPQDWAFCWGQQLNISQYQALFSVIGVTYGGNPQSNFNVPDLRGRAPMHSGTAPGAPSAIVGQAVGVPTVTLTENQLASHSHTAHGVQVLAGQSLTGTPSATTYPALTRYTSPNTNYDTWTTSGPTGTLAAQTLGPAGGADPHNNVSPYLPLNMCICLNGAVYPMRP